MRSAERNPFRWSRVEELPWLPVQFPLEEIYQAWRAEGFRGQLVAPHGSGKSFLSTRLLRRAQEDGLRTRSLFAGAAPAPAAWMEDWDAELRQVDPTEILLLDGLVHAPWWTRRRWLKAHPRVLIPAHTPLRLGALPLLAHWQADPSTLRALAEALDPQSAAQLLGPDGGAALLRQAHGNLRAALGLLYTAWAELPE